MTVIKIGANEIGRELKARARRTPGELQTAMRRAALRGRAMLVRRTPKDLGQAKAGWKVSQFVKGTTRARIDLYNDNPYVGILERGARPHKVSMEGIAALHAWVWRNRAYFKFSAETRKQGKAEALGIAYAIAAKIEREGQAPLYFVRKSMDELNRDFGVQLNDQIEKYSKRRATRAATRAAKADFASAAADAFGELK